MAESELANVAEQNTATATPVEMDRISSLPDCLLCHILSFLPSTTSVATSFLSRRWRHLWKDLQVFNFSVFSFYECTWWSSKERAHRRLVALLNTVLAHRRAPHIRRFRLRCELTESDRTAIETWVHTAIGPYLKELRLDLFSVAGCKLVLPPNIFSCTALVTLRLSGGNITVDPLTQRLLYHLPSLKTLELKLASLDNVDTLLSGCPVLENLTLLFDKRAWLRKTSAPKIHVPPSLKNLSIADCRIEELDIDTPSLEYLGIAATCDRLSVRNLHNVVEAHLDLDCQRDFVLKLLRELRATRFLLMRPSTVNCLLQAPLDLPEFKCLLMLELALPCFDTRFVMNMLEKCHMLRVLTIDTGLQDASRRWTQPVNVPTCLVSHLESIKFSWYCDSRDDREFFAYILQKGLVLKLIEIQPDLKSRSPKELSAIPRGSKMCQLYFAGCLVAGLS